MGRPPGGDVEPQEVHSFAVEHGAALLRYACLLTGFSADAEDLVQRAYLRLLEDPIRRPASPKAYVRRIIFNEYCTSRRGRTQSTEGVEIHTPSFENEVVLHRWMWSELALLSIRQRAVLVLRYYEGLPDEQISVILNCRRATVRSLAARALARLHERYQDSALSGAESSY